MQNRCLSHCVSKVEVHCFEIIKRAGLKIKLFLEWNISKRLFVVICVKYRLLELLNYGFLV